MRIRIEKEHLAELTLGEVVGDVFHRVRSNTLNVLILIRMDVSQRHNSILDIIRHFHADLHADRVLIRICFTEIHEKATVTAADWNWYIKLSNDMWLCGLSFAKSTLTISKLHLMSIWHGWIKLLPILRSISIVHILWLGRTKKASNNFTSTTLPCRVHFAFVYKKKFHQTY